MHRDNPVTYGQKKHEPRRAEHRKQCIGHYGRIRRPYELGRQTDINNGPKPSPAEIASNAALKLRVLALANASGSLISIGKPSPIHFPLGPTIAWKGDVGPPRVKGHTALTAKKA